VINHLLEDGDIEDLSTDGPSALRRLAEAASRDLAEGAEFRPFSTALVDLAIDLHDGKIGCPVVSLARRLGFHEDGLAFEFIEGGWYIVRPFRTGDRLRSTELRRHLSRRAADLIRRVVGRKAPAPTILVSSAAYGRPLRRGAATDQ